MTERTTAASAGEKPKIYHGNCLCGRVQFILAGEPFHYVICNCENCRRSSGSAFLTNAMFKTSQLTIVLGETDVKDYADGNTLSGRTITRSFCSNCGGNLFIKPTSGDITLIHSPAIEGSEAWVSKKESHPQDRLAWVKDITFVTKPKTKL